MTATESPTQAHKATSIAPTDSSSRRASEPTEGLCPLGTCIGIQLSSLTDSDLLALASAVQDEAQRRLRRDVHWDPLGLPRFLPQKVQKTQTSGEHERVARTGSRRGASQPAPTASPTVGASQAQSSAYVVERAEEHHQLSHVSLVGTVGGRSSREALGKPSGSPREALGSPREALGKPTGNLREALGKLSASPREALGKRSGSPRGLGETAT